MDAPSTWFDFSIECIYTAQKHKKHKAWRDGLCTCTFVRGWVVLKLFHEGANINSEPLEEWRLPPDVPGVVAKQEIELQVHLVQLLGCPQPLDGSWGPQLKPAASQHQDIPLCRRLQAEASRENVAPPKRRLPVGLLRPAGISPCGFRKPPGAAADRVENERHASRLDISAPACLQDFPSSRPPFVPPLRRLEVAPPPSRVPVPHEVIVNAARVVLLCTCSCSGCAQRSHCFHLHGTQPELSTASMFKKLFSADPGASVLSRVHQARRSVPPLHESRSERAWRPESDDVLEPSARLEAEDDCGVMRGSCGGTCFQARPQGVVPPPALQVEASAPKGGFDNCSRINSRQALGAHVREDKLCSDKEGGHAGVHGVTTGRFAAFTSGSLAPHF
ncbi:hypothetical protein ACSSS7_003669 [Eimeria intestinalis]